MTRLVTAGAAALVLMGTSLASAQHVPGSQAESRAEDFAQRQQVAAGYRDAATASTLRRSAYGYAAVGRVSSAVPGVQSWQNPAEVAARASARPHGGVAGR